MGRRFNITLGATTTAGGTVTTGCAFDTLDGVPLALEGDAIDCPACQGKGRIKCAGERVSSTFNGKQYALSDDLCICNCDPPPRLVANQTHMYQASYDGPGAMGWTTVNQLAASTMPHGTHDLAFEVKDATGQAMAGYPYLIELPDGTRLRGTTDRDGITRKVGAMSAAQATLTVYAPEPSPVDPDWDR
jgi:uncharacterized Zn-binding protein involved in type VI secretion